MSPNKQLTALLLNCTLKRTPRVSHTEGLMHLSKAIMEKQGIEVELLRPIDFHIPPGVQPDLTEMGYVSDDWTKLQEKVEAADILIIGSPIWLGEKSSICTKVIERLYGNSGKLNDKGEYIYYGKVGGCILTGNEDGAKHCAMNILYSLNHLGYTIPPQADAAWLGEIGPGPSYLDNKSDALENNFTNRNLTFMTWNLIHLARMLTENNIPKQGTSQTAWEDGERFGLPKPKQELKGFVAKQNS